MPDGLLSSHHYCGVHRHLFQDVYRWAGRFRSVRLGKSGNMFCYPENIRASMRKLFSDLRRQNYLRELTAHDFATGAAHFLAELNAIHPFREGNGRSQMTFVTLMAERAGHPFDLNRLKPKQFLTAMVLSFGGNEARLTGELRSLMRPRTRDSR